ncbi:MAG: fumarylacetoacetate hydrolase family protein, partial [Betaproteobacteria bacterium]|nr:fumarylacetoacetate hydrolase family protein [Betaproteobacteria bacterium]
MSAGAAAAQGGVDATHDPRAQSWVESANRTDCDFPLQNLPFGRFLQAGQGGAERVGVAIGDELLDLSRAAALLGEAGDAVLRSALQPLQAGDLAGFMAMGHEAWHAVRVALSQGLRAGSPRQSALAACLLAQRDVRMVLPCRIGDYTDFYTGIHHATSVGRLFRPDNPLMPNYKWVPIGYHGRASSIVASGEPVRRPHGQLRAPDQDPRLAPTQRLDYELELGAYIGPGNPLGRPVDIAQAERQVFGVCLLNDWSARDVQAWEYQPLGPFLAKNFATTVSPWVVTLEALAPFRAPLLRPPGDPAPLPYLHSEANARSGAFAVQLEV